VQLGVVQLAAVQLVVGDSCWKKSAGKDLMCDVKTLEEMQCSDIRSVCIQVKGEFELMQCGSEP
jgi:hypothetical protein